MKRSLLICGAALCAARAWADPPPETARQILALERQALDGWMKGDPDPALAISDAGITYIHVMTEKRIEGVAALKELYERFRGMPLYDSYEMGEPKVQGDGDIAVLTYTFVRIAGGARTSFHSTQVYQRKKEGWRVIHSHWSQIQPPQR